MSYFQLIARRFGDTEELRAAILEGTGVAESDLADAGAEINLAQQIRQIENMNRLFGEDWVLMAPELWRPSSHGALGVAAVSAPTIGAALEVLAKYVGARSPRHRFKLTRKGAALVLEHSIAAELSAAQWRPIVEADFMTVRAILEALLGRSPEDVTYRFTCIPPQHAERVRETLGGALDYAAAANAIVVPERYLDMRSPLADPTLHEYAREQLDAAMKNVGAPSGVRGRVERLLARSEHGRLPVSLAARTLGLSQRTLVRRLAEAGSSYRDLADDELRRRAARHLEAGVLSSAEISERLGFADPTGFSRACRRWFRRNNSVTG